MLNDAIKEFIIKHSDEDYPKEACGLLLNTALGITPVRCKNISNSPENNFLISNAESNSYAQMGEIVAFYHSHPENNSMSEVDKIVSERLKIKSIMYCNPRKTFEEYEPDGHFIALTNRPFILGILDCLTLVQDYYQFKLNINLPDFKHAYRNVDWLNNPEIVEKYNNKNSTELKNYFLNNGFSEVKQIKLHDVILMSAYQIKCPIHCVISIGSGEVLHHPAQSHSRKEPYTQALKKREMFIMRHKNLWI